MGRFWRLVMFILSGIGIIGGQQTGPSTQSPTMDEQPAQVKVYAVGPGVTAPELLPLKLPPFSVEKCKRKVEGTVEISLLVDANGQPRNLMFLHPLGTDLDKFALQIVAADRFNPGTHDGTPVTVGQSVEVRMQSCVVQTKDNTGHKALFLRLSSQPIQSLGVLSNPPQEAIFASTPTSWPATGNPPHTEKVSGGVSAPVPLNNINAVFTDAARRAKYQGVCFISLIVDEQGMPQNIQIVKKLDYGLDQNAVDAVGKYRFRPAMKGGRPVPAMITVEVNFRLY